MTAGVTTSAQFMLDDRSQIGAARRGIVALAEAGGLPAAAVGRVGIIATELATNLLIHATDGRLLVRLCHGPGGQRAIELLAVDAGPGMDDVARCLRDGHSTAGTPGNGLGAVQRLADTFEISSQPGAGSIVLARVGVVPRAPLRFGVVCLPMRGEEACGDGWEWCPDDRGGCLLVFDGLGHGPLAAEAADVARRVFRSECERAPEETLMLMHDRLQGTRGGAGAIARIDC
jgi:anti-sigma regulatory factor (Ser/Thr protein kinase)